MTNEKNSYYEVQARLLEQAKKDFDNQLDRFSTIWYKEVLNRKRKTKRGVIAEEVLTEISNDIYSDRPYFICGRSAFENAYSRGDVWHAQQAVSWIKGKLDGYKERVRKGVIDWYGY